MGRTKPREARRLPDHRRPLHPRRSRRGHLRRGHARVSLAKVHRLRRGRRSHLGDLRRATRLLRREGLRGEPTEGLPARVRGRAGSHRRSRGRALGTPPPLAEVRLVDARSGIHAGRMTPHDTALVAPDSAPIPDQASNRPQPHTGSPRRRRSKRRPQLEQVGGSFCTCTSIARATVAQARTRRRGIKTSWRIVFRIGMRTIPVTPQNRTAPAWECGESPTPLRYDEVRGDLRARCSSRWPSSSSRRPSGRG